MARDFYDEYAFVRELFDMTDELTQTNIKRLCFEGPMPDLTQTIHLQPAITTVNLAILKAITRENVQVDCTAGHSLGEYSALCAAKVISDENTIRLVYKRGQLMHRQSTRHEGAMHAVIGLPIDVVEQLVAAASHEGSVSVANHNTELQIVTTGSPKAVATVSAMAGTKGAKTIPLRVSGAWHSEFMKGAADEFRTFLNGIPFNVPSCAVVHNVTAGSEEAPAKIREIMIEQLYSPVRWYDSVLKMIADGVEVFAEIGPGKVLTGLVKKIIAKDHPVALYTINSLKSMESFLDETTRTRMV